MANKEFIARKGKVVDEITNKVKESSSTILFEYQGLTVGETMELRRKLRETGSDYKVYKNTLVKRALDSLNINMDDELSGPKAVAFGTDAIAPIKVLGEFAKDHQALVVKIGYVDGKVTDQGTLAKLATLPSRDQLLTMFAAGLLEHVKNVAICLDLHSQNMEN